MSPAARLIVAGAFTLPAREVTVTLERSEIQAHPNATNRRNDIVRASGCSKHTVTRFLHGESVRKTTRLLLEMVCERHGIAVPPEAK